MQINIKILIFFNKFGILILTKLRKMNKLKVCFLWHQHQPYYKIENEFLLPWVLFHGTKDYFDLPEILYEYPNIKQTFNIVPSLSLQIQEYIEKKAKDKIQSLTLIPATELQDSDKEEIIKYFFACNYKNMIVPNRRYYELYEIQRRNDFTINEYQTQDWLDLQVLYNLVWFGYFSSKRNIVKRLLEKGRDYSESEKILLIDEQLEVLASINQQYIKLKSLGQVSLSCSPMYHPILPLIIDSKSVLENLPNNNLPRNIFQYPNDAQLQIENGIEYFKKSYNFIPMGMWPSEGSISNRTLDMFIQNNIKWAASDELVLNNSLSKSDGLDKYFPFKYKNNNGEVILFFRDHNLSDKIGFTYSNWNEKDAANDFINNLKNIRNSLISTYGDSILNEAVVSVILDGENCWEYYKDNGVPFLRELFNLLQNDEEIETELFDNIVVNNNINREINHIKAGSWINGNFSIWMGDKEDITAWELLYNARNILELQKSIISDEEYKEALQSILIAEGSDWFWWYGPEHPTELKPIFDSIFRHHLKKIYNILSIDCPKELEIPIWEYATNILSESKPIENNINSIFEQYGEYIYSSNEQTSMHQSGNILKYSKRIIEGNKLYLEIEFDSSIKDINNIVMQINVNNNNSEHIYNYILNYNK